MTPNAMRVLRAARRPYADEADVSAHWRRFRAWEVNRAAVVEHGCGLPWLYRDGHGGVAYIEGEALRALLGVAVARHEAGRE